MYLFRILAVCIFITSCGGGGGGGSPAVPFALTLASNSFSTDEDTSYSGSFAASANETVTLEYLLTETTSNGSLSFSNTANIVYNPNPNFFGQDEFTYSVTAVEKNITRTSTVTITVAAVNDRPEIFITSKASFNKDTLVFESNPSFDIAYSDVDNVEEDFIFSASIDGNDIPIIFTSTGQGSGTIDLDLTNIQRAGFLSCEINISDGDLGSTDSLNTWFISNKQIITVSMDDDKSDGFDSGTSTDKDYYVYYLVGGGSSFGRTDYLFVADSLERRSIRWLVK
ncbi:MAG: Ig-like domain-containing protein [Gammaproteobacteria bacterium]